MNELQLQHIQQQALNFWTGKSFEICCNEHNCHMTASMMKDGSYQVISDAHGYEIRIERTSDEQLTEDLAAMLDDIDAGKIPREYKADWDLRINNVSVAKDSWLEPEEILFWDEVALRYQEIPEWLVPAMDEAFEQQHFQNDLEEAEREAATVEFLHNLKDSINLFTESLGIEGQLDLHIGDPDYWDDWDDYETEDMAREEVIHETLDRIMDKIDYDSLTKRSQLELSRYLGPAFSPKDDAQHPLTDHGDFCVGDGTRELSFDFDVNTQPTWFKLTPEEQKELDDFLTDKWSLSAEAEQNLMKYSEIFKNPKAQHEEGYREACQCEMQTLMSNGCQCGGA